MRRTKISKWLASAIICSLLLAAGCAPTGEKAAKPTAKIEKQKPEAEAKGAAVIALKFTPNDSTTYKVISEAERGIKFEGSVPENDPNFKGGHNDDKLEMTFTQEIQTVDDKGNAIVKITVKGIKYSSIVKDSTVFAFDSTKPHDPNHQLALLIGQSYTIRMAPTGEVTEVIDTKDADMAVRGGFAPPVIALRLLQAKAIRERHGTLVLPDPNKDKLHIGESWSNTKTFSFGEMAGSESYEKIYTLSKIENQDNRKIAIVDMKAIPASETAKEQAKVLQNSDNKKTYTGQLKFDLTAGKINKYSEKLTAEWITALPSDKPKENKGPTALILSDIRSYSLEKID